MSILDRFKKQPRIDFNPRYFFSGGTVPPNRSTEGSLKAYGEIGWLYAVVFRIALGCSEVKWTLQDITTPDKPKQILQHPILRLLNLVNPFMTSNEFIALHTIYKELVGESFWILNFNRLGEPGEIWVPYPHKMSVVPDKQKFIKGYVYGEGEKAIPFDVNEVIHFKYPSPLNQYRGLGPAQSIAVDLDAEMYSGLWNRNFFYNSARPDGVIQYDYELSNEQFEKLRKQWMEKYKGVSKAHQVALLEGGGKYVQIQNTVKDMDFSSLKLRNRDVILGVFGMPQSVMGISENVNKANAEAGDYTFARWIVKPRLDWDAAKLQEQLIPKFRKSDNLKLGFEEVVPQTAEQKRLDAESGIRASYWTVNEARVATGKDPLPNDAGEILLVPFNILPTPVKELSATRPPPNPQQMGKGFTEERKRAYWEAYAQKTARQESLFEGSFIRIFKEQGKQVVAKYKETGNFDKSLFDDKKTAEKFVPAYEIVFGTAFKNAIKSIKQWQEIDPYALDWIQTRSLTLSSSINSTSADDIQRLLGEGFEAGEGINEIAKHIENYFDDSARYRSQMVARTEVIAASNEGALHRYETEGIAKAEFYPAPDSCPECQALIGEYPASESHGMIPVHPNCRCTWLPVIETQAINQPQETTRLEGEDWIKSLPKEEQEALKSWQGSSQQVRTYQRTGEGTPKFQKMTNNLESALDKANPYKGNVYRGISDLDNQTYNILKNQKQFTWDALSSSSADEKIALRFARGSPDKNGVVFKIANKTGVDISAINPAFAYEKEVILRKDAVYKVVKMQETTPFRGPQKVLEITLKEI